MYDEIVLCAAIHFDDGDIHYHQPINISSGFVIAGYRHGSILGTAHAVGCKVPFKNQTQGFLTNKNRFLNRLEARNLVVTTGQCNPEFKEELYSEDLY